MNNRRIFQISALAVGVVCAAVLASCLGGGGSGVVRTGSQVQVAPPTSNVRYGAVYSYRSNNLQEFRYYYGGNTQAWINNHALTNCRAGSSRSSCRIEASFTNCVALARDNRIQAYATGNDLASARSSALAQCRRLGGTGCSNFSSNCNAPVTRQASKVGGTSNSIPSPTAPTEQPTPPPSGNVKHGAVYSWQGSSDNKRYARVSSSVVEDTAAAARSAGLAACTGLNCRVEFTFTNCAAVADSDGFEYTGIATGNTLASARSSALAECTRLGGAGCELDGSERCNDPVAPQTSIVRGISNSAPAPAPTVTLTLADSSISENGGSTTVSATLSHASSASTTITVTAVSGAYTVGADKTITIAAGSTSNNSDTATINAVDNTRDEANRSVTVTATAQNSQGIGAVTGASLTLEDDDSAPTVTLSLADSSISENGGTTTVSATLSHASSAATTITLSAVSGAYMVGADKTITIAAGNTSNSSDTATINAVDNTRDEANRSVTVTATAQNSQGIGAVTGASLTLEDDDLPPLPTVYEPSVDPQASGRDISTIEISGLGRTSRFAVRNSGRTEVSIPAGSWYEPKDGSFQRMIVTQTTSVPPGRVVEVPIACMQRGKSTPALGLRFFSQPKVISGSVQRCQRNCLSSALTARESIQSCVWRCERTAAPLYVSIAYGERPRTGRQDKWSWATGSGRSASEAQRDARNSCSNGLGSTCETAVNGYTGCYALALSDCPAERCDHPASAIQFASTRAVAERDAVRACQSAIRVGTCRIPTGDNGLPASLCGRP